MIVVGTGVAGASSAYALARRGAEVVAIDSNRVGQATAAGAGIIQPWSSAAATSAPWYELYLAGAAYYPTLLDRLGEDGSADVGYARSGSLVVSSDEALLADVESRTRRHQPSRPEVGEVARITPAQARALFPPLAPHLSAVHISGGGRVDGRKLRLGLLDGARRHGSLVLSGEACLLFRDGAVTGVRAGDSVVNADAVVVAGGAWSNGLLAPLGLRLPVQPQRGQILHLEIPGVDPGGWPSIHPLNSHYMVCFAGRVVVGATRETGSGFDPRITAGGLHEVLTAALSIAPGLACATHIETRVGLRPLSPEHVPQIGLVPGVPGLAVITGFGAAGLTMGPIAGELIADMIFGVSPALDMSPFMPTAETTNTGEWNPVSKPQQAQEPTT